MTCAINIYLAHLAMYYGVCMCDLGGGGGKVLILNCVQVP